MSLSVHLFCISRISLNPYLSISGPLCLGSLSPCLYLYLPATLSLYSSISPPFYVSNSLSLSLSLCSSIPLCLPLSPYLASPYSSIPLLFLYLSIPPTSLSLHSFIYEFLYLFLSISLPLYRSIFLSLCFSISLSLYPSRFLYLSIPLSLYLSNTLFLLFPSISVFLYPPFPLPLYLFILYLSISIFLYPSDLLTRSSEVEG